MNREREIRIAQGGAKFILILLAALLLVRLLGMAALPLMDTTEARYGEIGRKMAELNDWVTPWHDHGVPFWGKPPLSFWLTAASLKVLGVGAFAARLPHLLCALGIGWATWRLARSRPEALFALALLSGSALFYVSAGAVMTDAALVLGTTLAMLGFWRGLAEPAMPSGRWLLFAGVAFGLLAKGPLALVLIGTPLVGWTALQRRARAVWQAFPWLVGMLCVAVLVLPWYVAAESRTPGFLNYFIVGEHWHRFMTPGWKGDLYGNAHRFPIGTVWVFAFVATLPWSLLLPAAAVWRRKQALPAESEPDVAWRGYLLLWALTPLVLFTAARNIIWTYALPALPALALLLAGRLTRWPEPLARRLVGTGLAVSLAGALIFGIHAFASGRPENKSAKTLMQAAASLCPPTAPLLYHGGLAHSAAFYSAGRTQRVATLREVQERLGTQAGCLVTRREEAPAVNSLERTSARSIARSGGEVLWWLTPQVGSTAPATDVR